MARHGLVFRAAPLRVRVPATSANLGPGFDALGLALTLYDDVVVRVTDEPGLTVDVAGAGAASVPRNGRNLVVRAMRTTFDTLGGLPRGFEVVCANRIPHGRGLGSSAAAIVAGVLAARGLVAGGAERLPDTEVLALATRIEGHPDNVAACLYGGLTVATVLPGGNADEPAEVVAADLPVSADLAPVALVPVSRSSTRSARKLLPDNVSHLDAAANSARVALLVTALSTRPDLLLVATEDRLHQQYREPAMPRTLELVRRLREEGVPAVVSGAGPTVLALTTSGGRALPSSVVGRGWTVLDLDVDREGAQLLPV